MIDRKITAFHEAGHTCMAYLKKVRINKVSIEPDNKETYLGYLNASNKFERATNSINQKEKNKKRIVDFILISLAGLCSEHILTGKMNYEFSRYDLEIAKFYLQLITNSEHDFNELYNILLNKTEQLLRKTENWIMVTSLAEYLLISKPTLSGKKIKEIFCKCNPEIEENNINFLFSSMKPKIRR